MKITASKLQEIIKEELENYMSEEEEGGDEFTSDTEQALQRMDRGKAIEWINQRVNLPQEFLELMKAIIELVEISPQRELAVLKQVYELGRQNVQKKATGRDVKATDTGGL
jgi:hypothetical protein